jgi:hypothetical protein
MTALLEELPQAQLTRDAAEQLARREVDRLRVRRGLAVVVAGDLGDVIPGVRLRMAVDGIVVRTATRSTASSTSGAPRSPAM